MGTTATIIAISYLVVVVLGSVLALGLARSTRRRRREADTAMIERRERTWLVVVLAMLSALLVGTILFIPYGQSAPEGAQVVQVEAVQFGWIVQPVSVRAGAPVEFRLTSRDVNHGFGVYDEGGELLFQVQVVPGDLQQTVYTFERTGTYEILCLEYCGVGHHVMRGTLEVTPP